MVARTVRVRKVAGSNPAAPTIFELKPRRIALRGFHMYGGQCGLRRETSRRERYRGPPGACPMSEVTDLLAELVRIAESLPPAP